MPRSSRRLGIRLVAALVVVATALAAGASASAAREEPVPDRILVVSIPTLTWEQVIEHQPPVLTGLFARSAVASLSLRTFGIRTTAAEAYATIGAGNRAAMTVDAGVAADVDESLFGEPVAAVYRRRTRAPLGDAEVVHLDFPALASRNDRLNYGAEPGRLGEALSDEGVHVAVVGNADTTLPADPVREDLHREVALAGVDASGRVGRGTVSSDLLELDPAAPFGMRLDRAAFAPSLASRWGDGTVAFAELSDVARADEFGAVATSSASREAMSEAVAHTDAILADLLGEVDLDRDLVMVIAPTSPAGEEQLTVASLAGPGVQPGLLRSGTTRRAGFVTLPDIGPTLLDRLDIEIPTEMSGAPISVGSAGAVDVETFESLADDNLDALFRNEVSNGISSALISLQVILYAAAAAILHGWWARARSVVAMLALVTMAVPAVAFLSGAVPPRVLGPVGYGLALFGAAAALAMACAWMGRRLFPDRRRALVAAPVLLAWVTVVVLIVDILVGGPLQLATPFGYGGGAIVAGRFAGYGNLAWAALAAAAVMAVAGTWALVPPPARAQWRRHLLIGATVVSLVAVVAIGLPQLGLNVGGTLSALPGLAVLVLLLAGARITWRRVVLIGLGPVAALALFGLLDLTRDPEERTHLGRFLELAGDQGSAGVTTVIERKISANLSILTSTVWALMIPAGLIFVAYLLHRPPNALQRLQDKVAGLRAGLASAVVIGALGAVLNDSGVAITGMVLVIVLPVVTWLAMHLVAAERAP